ncbi:hypothetical protein OOZ63_17415 [Paucibacter sp. PLA-PC-4]|uniref:hypothetical protein n=1 Tax=Paucibacter sp. PLA-PC-4 TaxID=2993655 RepID=UPI00224B976D|nr:hypothetical protein [Paucibacter sp. PLA-PC-4]MCX2863613.1 hypothetical protein [Paucibacter sp. PLA-PC-4]
MTSQQMRLPQVLLVEPQFVLRRTLGSVGAELRLAEVTEALSVEAAQAKLNAASFDALILGGIETTTLTEFVTQIRSGQAGCPADIRIVVMQSPAMSATRETLEQIGADVVIERPFKVGQVFSAALTTPIEA